MKIRIAALAMLVACCSVAGEKIYLWPEGKMPNAQAQLIAATTDISGCADFKADDYRKPYVEWCEKPANPNGGCIIMISGGGYECLCDIGLLKMWEKKFTAIGFQCVNLVYRSPRAVGLPIHQVAWEDGQRAVRVVRSEAVKRGLDPERIGTISMSAGSHLAVLLSTSSMTPAYAPVDDLDKTSAHINWAITGAIAYALTDGIGEPNTTQGNGPDVKLDSIFKFDEKTAPMCMFHGSKDQYSPIASTFVYRRLREINVPAELHLFADRSHGFWGEDRPESEATSYNNWFGRAEEFLRQLGFLGELESEVDLMTRYATDDARGDYKRQEVWPADKMPDVRTNQCTPFIEWHFPKELKTKAIQIIYSGGGYEYNSPEGFEVTPTRRFLNEKGMTVVTLKYRIPRPYGLAKHVTAWQDLQRTIRIVRSQAPKYGLDPDRIGIMGSSAGGHLTLMGVTSSGDRAYEPIDELDEIPCNVQWGVAIYPAYALTDGTNMPNSTRGNADSAVLVPEFKFDAGTCPVVFIHGDADCWAAMNSVKCWEKLRRMDIHCDLHTLCKRSHCFQRTAAPGTGSYSWMGRIWEFMNHRQINR